RAEQLHVLVVDVVDLVRAELADLASTEHRAALALFLVARFLVAAAAAAAAPSRTSLSERHLNLHPFKSIIVGIFGVHRAPFSGLALRRQSAFDSPALRFGLSLRPGAIDHLFLLVHANAEMADHLVEHLEPAIDLLH